MQIILSDGTVHTVLPTDQLTLTGAEYVANHSDTDKLKELVEDSQAEIKSLREANHKLQQELDLTTDQLAKSKNMVSLFAKSYSKNNTQGAQLDACRAERDITSAVNKTMLESYNTLQDAYNKLERRFALKFPTHI